MTAIDRFAAFLNVATINRTLGGVAVRFWSGRETAIANAALSEAQGIEINDDQQTWLIVYGNPLVARPNGIIDARNLR